MPKARRPPPSQIMNVDSALIESLGDITEDDIRRDRELQRLLAHPRQSYAHPSLALTGRTEYRAPHMASPPSYGAVVEQDETAEQEVEQDGEQQVDSDSTIVIRLNGDEGFEDACVCNCCCCGCSLGNPLSAWLCGFGFSIGKRCGVTLCCIPFMCSC